MILRAKSALQTACQGAHAAFDGVAPHARRPRRSRAVLKVLQLPRKRRKNMPVSLTAALQFLPTRMDRPALPVPGSILLAGAAQQRSFVRPYLTGTGVAGCPAP